MSGVNKVILVGNLGQDPETRYTAAGNCITNLSLATSESWKDKESGQKQERTEWHRIVLFGKTAEVAGKHLFKGSKVYIEGGLRTNKWKDKTGADRYTTEIVVGIGGQMQMLDSTSDPSSKPAQQSAPQAQPQQPSQRPRQEPQAALRQPQAAGNANNFDDIPY